MFLDLNVPISVPSASAASGSGSGSKKGKAKQQQQAGQSQSANTNFFTTAQLTAIDAHVDLLAHLGYTVICFNQTIHKKYDPKIHVNVLNELLSKLKIRQGIVYLKRLSVILDEDSEKGFGFINSHTQQLSSYDILSLIPTTQPTFALACLTHTLPSPLTTHIIYIPLTFPGSRSPFHLKHTLIRTALKNGAVFEINYVGALGGEADSVLMDAGAAEAVGTNAKRNWWANARELCRVTKGKGIVVSGGVVKSGDLRGPRDVANLVSLLGIPQDAAHAACTSIPKSLVLRAQTRKTYRAVFSEPELVIPPGYTAPTSKATEIPASIISDNSSNQKQNGQNQGQQPTKKRPREKEEEEASGNQGQSGEGNGAKAGQSQGDGAGEAKKKKRKKDKQQRSEGTT